MNLLSSCKISTSMTDVAGIYAPICWHKIGEPYSIGGVEQLIGASIGVALIPEDGTSADELLRLADLAMYEAKSAGRNCYCFFSPRMNQIAQLNAGVESDLREALNSDQLFLEYQPIVDTTNWQLCRAWKHWSAGSIRCAGGLVPADFIRVANDSRPDRPHWPMGD